MPEYSFPAPSQEEIDRAFANAKRHQTEVRTDSFVDVDESTILAFAGALQESQRQLADAEKKLAEALANGYDPRYIYEPQPGAPEWMPKAIKSKVWVRDYIQKQIRFICRHREADNVFVDTEGAIWPHAEPIEKAPKWAPEDTEPVAYYWADSDKYKVMDFADFKRQNWSEVPRCAHWSGQRDMRVEALADEPRYQP